jgi:hypothetical protein
MIKKYLLALSLLNLSLANASEVCKLASTSLFGSSTNLKVECTTFAVCTDQSILVKHTDQLRIGHIDYGCDLAEAKSIKDLIDLGYQLQADGKTLIKY